MIYNILQDTDATMACSKQSRDGRLTLGETLMIGSSTFLDIPGLLAWELQTREVFTVNSCFKCLISSAGELSICPSRWFGEAKFKLKCHFFLNFGSWSCSLLRYSSEEGTLLCDRCQLSGAGAVNVNHVFRTMPIGNASAAIVSQFYTVSIGPCKDQ